MIAEKAMKSGHINQSLRKGYRMKIRGRKRNNSKRRTGSQEGASMFHVPCSTLKNVAVVLTVFHAKGVGGEAVAGGRGMSKMRWEVEVSKWIGRGHERDVEVERELVLLSNGHQYNLHHLEGRTLILFLKSQGITGSARPGHETICCDKCRRPCLRKECVPQRSNMGWDGKSVL